MHGYADLGESFVQAGDGYLRCGGYHAGIVEVYGGGAGGGGFGGGRAGETRRAFECQGVCDRRAMAMAEGRGSEMESGVSK